MSDYSSQFDSMFTFKPKAKPPAEPTQSSAPVPEPVLVSAPAEESTAAVSDVPAPDSGGGQAAPEPASVQDAGEDVPKEPVQGDEPQRESVPNPAPEQEPMPATGPAEPDASGNENDLSGDVQRADEGRPARQPYIHRPRMVAAPGDADKTSRVELPKAMVSAIRAVFPNAENRNEAVAAYIYTMMGREGSVPERIKELSGQFPDDDRVIDLQSKLKALSEDMRSSNAAMSKRVRELQATLDQVLTLLVWVVGERSGSKMDISASADRLDFLFPDHEVIRNRSAKQAGEYSDQKAHQDGLETSRRVNLARDRARQAGQSGPSRFG